MREPREQLVLDLLDDEWVASNTFGEVPTITYGWFEDPPQKPYINVLQPDEGPLGGGETGYDGITGGGTPHQTINSIVDIHIFAATGELDGASTSHPREYLTGSADRSTGDVSGGAVAEVQRIIRDNAVKPTNPKTGNQPIQVQSPGTSRPVAEPDDIGVFHYVTEIQQIYTVG